MCTFRERRRNGFSLIELVIFIAVVGAAVAGVLLALDFSARNSADPIVRKQAIAIAESMLEEIVQMPFTYCDPNDANVSTATGAFVGANGCAATVEVIGPELGETRYSANNPFNNVNDYNGYSTAAEVPPGTKDIDGTPITGLSAYNVAVVVAPVVLGGIPNTGVLQITVTVTGPSNVTVVMDGFRTEYAPNL